MNAEIGPREIKWYDKKLLTRSIVIGLIFFGIFFGLAKRVEPPESYIFEKLPPINGIYHCCDAGGRYSRSWVDGQTVSCFGLNYYPFLGNNRNDCGFKGELNGRVVEVTQVIVPSITRAEPVVIRMAARGEVYKDFDDARIRDLWIGNSRASAFVLAFILAIIFHTIQMILADRVVLKINEVKA